ncbi:sigma-54-dependent transcriptional regulator [Thermosulfuriphilus sp.]
MVEPVGKILIIDDDPAIRDGCFQVLTRSGYEAEMAASGAEALELLDRWEFDVILLDLKMPDVNGLDLLRQIRDQDSQVHVIVITAFGTVENAVQAMKLGAFDFLPKPFEPEELRLLVRRAMEAKRLAMENLYLRQELEAKAGETQLVGRSRAIKEILEKVSMLAPTDSTVLITGESGTGKGLLARKIHEMSPRRDHPFVTVDCSTLVPTLFESELFGHVKGAFTGATTHKVGKFELANGGTLFFDEIGNISLDIQAKLLRAVEEKEISRVGSHRVTKVDVRIIAATNQDLQEAVKKGAFREDLFYRLNVVALELPPLRERREDIPLLVDFFLKRFTERHRKEVRGLSSEALEALMGHDWPGNVRELENTIERLVIFARRPTISLEDLYLAGFKSSEDSLPDTDDDLSLAAAEKRHVLMVLKRCQGNKTVAAQLLKIDRKTLREKLKRWGV